MAFGMALVIWCFLLSNRSLSWHSGIVGIHQLRITTRYRSRANTETTRAGNLAFGMALLLVWLLVLLCYSSHSQPTPQAHSASLE
jgi:hypothetical protein